MNFDLRILPLANMPGRSRRISPLNAPGILRDHSIFFCAEPRLKIDLTWPWVWKGLRINLGQESSDTLRMGQLKCCLTFGIHI